MQPNTTPHGVIPFNPDPAPPQSDTVEFELSIVAQPTGQHDVVATPKVKGLRTVVLARCRSERVARILTDALAAEGFLP